MIHLYIKNNKYTKIALLAIITYVTIIFFSKGLENNDFRCYYVAIKFLQKFSLDALYNISVFTEFHKAYFPKMEYGWFYPPHYVFQIYFFGLLPFWLANFLFCILGIGLFAAAIYCICQKVDLTQNILFYTLATPFVGFTLLTSQNSLYTASFLLIGLHFIDRKPVIAGLCFALMSYKPQFVIVIPFALLLTKNYKTFAYAGLFFIIQVIASMCVFGGNAWITFFQTTNKVWYLLANNGLPINMMASSFATFMSFGLSQSTAKLLSLIWFVGISGIVLYIWHLRKGDTIAKALLSAGICLASPYLFHYDTAVYMVSVIFFIHYKNFELSYNDIQSFCVLIIFFIGLLLLSLLCGINLLILCPIFLFVYFFKHHKCFLKNSCVV